MQSQFKLSILTACLCVTPTLYAESFEQRISLLEQELAKIKIEQQQANQQLSLSNEKLQQRLEAQPLGQQNPIRVTEALPIPALKSTLQVGDSNIKFYGIIRMDGSLDLKDSNAAPFINGQLHEVDRTPHSNRSGFSLTATRLGMDLSRQVNDVKVKGKLEMDFWDGKEGNGTLHIRHAYLDFNQWLFGQTVSGMTNLETLTESVDYTMFLGYAATRTPQVRYNFNLATDHDLKIAAEYVSARSSELPALTAKYSFKEGNLTGVAQAFVHEKRAELANKDIDKMAWGTGLGAKYQITPTQSLQAHWYHIVGDQKFIPYSTQTGKQLNGYASAGDFSVNDSQTDLDLNQFNTFVLGYSHKFSDQWRSNIAVSRFEYDDDTTYARNNPSLSKNLTDLSANIFYTPLAHVDLGLEYHHGKRESFEGDEFNVSRFNFVSTYKF